MAMMSTRRELPCSAIQCTSWCTSKVGGRFLAISSLMAWWRVLRRRAPYLQNPKMCGKVSNSVQCLHWEPSLDLPGIERTFETFPIILRASFHSDTERPLRELIQWLAGLYSWNNIIPLPFCLRSHHYLNSSARNHSLSNLPVSWLKII